MDRFTTLTTLARKTEYDFYQRLRDLIPGSQNSIDDLAKCVKLDNGEPRRLKIEVEEYYGDQAVFLYCDYSKFGEPLHVRVKLKSD